jgi:hypothetical protein
MNATPFMCLCFRHLSAACLQPPLATQGCVGITFSSSDNLTNCCSPKSSIPLPLSPFASGASGATYRRTSGCRRGTMPASGLTPFGLQHAHDWLLATSVSLSAWGCIVLSLALLPACSAQMCPQWQPHGPWSSSITWRSLQYMPLSQRAVWMPHAYRVNTASSLHTKASI